MSKNKRMDSGMSFSQYSESLSSALSGDIFENKPHLEEPLSQMLGILALTLTGKGSFSKKEIRIARSGVIYHPSGIIDALFGNASSMTGVDVGTHRIFGRNFDIKGKRHEASDKYPALGRELFQYRAVEGWTCNKNGESDDIIATMNSILSASGAFRRMVRENFKAIDQKSMAVARLNADMCKLEETPIHTLSIALAKTSRPLDTINKDGLGSIAVSELMIMSKLNGETDVVFRDESGSAEWVSKLSWMQSASLLQMLPDKIEAAHKNFGPKL